VIDPLQNPSVYVRANLVHRTDTRGGTSHHRGEELGCSPPGAL